MTGQILGGTPPALAARYQIVVMFLISSAAAMSVTGASAMAVAACTDGAHRLHAGALRARPRGGGAGDPLRAAAARVAGAAAAARGWLASRGRSGAAQPLLDAERDATAGAAADEAATP